MNGERFALAREMGTLGRVYWTGDGWAVDPRRAKLYAEKGIAGGFSAARGRSRGDTVTILKEEEVPRHEE